MRTSAAPAGLHFPFSFTNIRRTRASDVTERFPLASATLKSVWICRQSNISVNRHQLEFLWIGSGTADDVGGFCSASGLRSNHLGLVLDISALPYLEELIGPILSPEINPVLSLNLVILSAAQPLV